MNKISEYHEKQQQIEILQKELEKLEKDPAMQKELELKAALEKLMDDYSKSAEQVLAMLKSISPSLTTASPEADTKRSKRALVEYKNPHTGETVKTRGANQKTLKLWRDQYGEEAVRSWKA